MAAHRLPGAERVVAWAERYPRVSDVARKLHGGLAVAGRPRTLGEAILLSCFAWGATIIAFAAAGQALGVQLTTAQAALLASGVALASAIPAGPSNLGTFDLAATIIAGSFGLSKEKAVALAFTCHAAVIIVTSIGGAISLLRLGWARRPPAPISEVELGTREPEVPGSPEGTEPAAAPIEAVVFDLGAVCIDWNPRYLYRSMFGGDDVAMECFLTEVCSQEWNAQIDGADRGRRRSSSLSIRAPRVARAHPGLPRAVGGDAGRAIDGTVEILDRLQAPGSPRTP